MSNAGTLDEPLDPQGYLCSVCAGGSQFDSIVDLVTDRTEIDSMEAKKLIVFLRHETGRSDEQIARCLIKAHGAATQRGIPLRGAVQYAVSHFRVHGACPNSTAAESDSL